MNKKRIDVKNLSNDQISAVLTKLEIAEREFPSLFMVPNIAQYRALQEIYTPEEDGHFPDMVSVEFANGVGKTTLFIMDLIGWSMGPGYLNERLFPEEAVKFWKGLDDKRDCGSLSMRLVCAAVDMKEGGSVLAIIKMFFPWAKMTKQDNTGCFKQIDIPHPTIPNIVNHVAVFTFDQDAQKHAGPTCDRIFINENLPEELWTETNARTRGGGNIVQFATILEHSTHLSELEDGEHFILKRCKGHIYENCKGEEVTDDMAEEVYRELGIKMEKSASGKGYETNGVLSRRKIEAMIEGWQKTNPSQVQARKTGRPITEGCKIFLQFDENIHVVKNDIYKNVPVDWPMVMLCDPHPARPDAVIWVQMLSSDRLCIVDEWPTFHEHGYFDKIKESRYTIQQKTDIWKDFEGVGGYHERVVERIGDPNRFREPDEQSNGNLRDLYTKYGYTFNIDINDSLQYGLELVNQYLWYDSVIRRLLPNDPSGKPRLTVYERCINTKRAMSNFSWKTSGDNISETVDKRFECFSALVRYLIVWHQNHHFSEMQINPNRVTDYELLNRGRSPGKKTFAASGPFNRHGRTVVGSFR